MLNNRINDKDIYYNNKGYNDMHEYINIDINIPQKDLIKFVRLFENKKLEKDLIDYEYIENIIEKYNLDIYDLLNIYFLDIKDYEIEFEDYMNIITTMSKSEFIKLKEIYFVSKEIVKFIDEISNSIEKLENTDFEYYLVEFSAFSITFPVYVSFIENQVYFDKYLIEKWYHSFKTDLNDFNKFIDELLEKLNKLEQSN